VVEKSLEALRKEVIVENPLRVIQYTLKENQRPRSVVCKFNSVRHLIASGAFRPGDIGIQRSCRIAHQRMVYAIYPSIAHAGLRRSPADFVLESDRVDWLGAMLRRPENFAVLQADEDRGSLHLRARRLSIPNLWYLPLPNAMKGLYCQLIAPGYLAELMRRP
ncbi:MAG: hypothetical protein ACK5HY_15035, partial [Parahaliea sp.]